MPQRPRKYKIVRCMRGGIKFHQALLLDIAGGFIAAAFVTSNRSTDRAVRFCSIICRGNALAGVIFHSIELQSVSCYSMVAYEVVALSAGENISFK